MRLNHKKYALLGALSLAISGCGSIDGVDDGPGREKAPRAQPDNHSMEPANPYDVSTDPYNPADTSQYDDVGYAASYDAGQTSTGEAFNPSAMSAGHSSLTVPSYVEVTLLTTGKTILVRVNDRISGSTRQIISLSPGAMQLLNGGDDGRVAVRVRRVNPPEQEKSALKMGQKAGDRLDTPEPLLVALRRKLGSDLTPVSARPATIAARPQPVKTQPTQTTQRPGARYDPPAPVRQSASGDRFIIEDGSKAIKRPVQTTSPASDRYFIQIAAFSDQGRAVSLARQLGARAEQAGSVWRVRKGPYSDEESARAALGPIAAKGYRDARITR